MLNQPRLAAALAVELRKMITGDLKPGDRMPSEKDLADQFGVSRNTVRESLLILWDEGLVVRKWGVGTFVRDSEQPITQSMSTVVPVHEFMKTSSSKITLTSAKIEKVPCPDDAAAALSLEPGSEIWYIDRTFAFDGKPAFILLDWVPLVVNGRPIDPTALTSVEVGLLELLREKAHCVITRMEAQFSAVGATEEQAARFGIDVGTPLIADEQVSIDNAGEIAMFSRNYYHTAVSTLHLVRSTRNS